MLDARSIREAGLYIDLHPCSCGNPGELNPELSLERRDGRQVAVYAGTCIGCGQERRYEFAIEAAAAGGPAYGGAAPSRILDPGEFLWVSDNATDRALSLIDVAGESDRTAAQTSFEEAILALDEVLKFVAVDTTALSVDHIRSTLGRAVYETNPDRFQLERLHRRRDLLHDAQSRLHASRG